MTARFPNPGSAFRRGRAMLLLLGEKAGMRAALNSAFRDPQLNGLAISILEPVWKLRGALRRGILAVAKAASSEHPRSGLYGTSQRRPRTKDPPPGGLSRKRPSGFVAPQSKIHQGYSPSSRLIRFPELFGRRRGEPTKAPRSRW